MTANALSNRQEGPTYFEKYWKVTLIRSLKSLLSESDSLDLGGPFYVGGVDYMDQSLQLPPQVWSASLKQGFVGCLKGEFD